MSKFLLYLFLALLLMPSSLLAQRSVIIRGMVTDSLSGEPIAYANVFIKDTTIGSPTNTSGYYAIAGVPRGKITLVASFIGYEVKEVQLVVRTDEVYQVNFELVPSTLELDNISVIGQETTRPNETDLGLEITTMQEIEMLPRGVELDVLRALQYSPAVKNTGDVNARFFVRGGNSDQNLVLLNNAPLYNPYHALGLFSIIDPENVSLLEFHKGGFTAEYGGRISSVLNLVTKGGNRSEVRGSAQASMLAGKFSVEGPIPNGSFFTTFRKSYYADAAKPFLDDQSVPFDFYDGAFKLRFANDDFYKNARFELHGLFSGDVINYNDPLKADYDFRNVNIGFNWSQIWASPFFSVFSFSYTKYFAEILPNSSGAFHRKNEVIDLNSSWDFTYLLKNGDEIQVGYQNKIFTSKLNQQNLQGSETELDRSGLSMNLYGKYKLYISETIGMDIGTRINLITISRERGSFLEPRISFTYRPNPAIGFQFAAGHYTQEVITLINENDLVAVYEPWIVVPEGIAIPEATHFSAGLDYYLTDAISIGLEGYYKMLTNITDINEAKYTVYDQDFISVDGRSYGIELETELRSGIFSVTANYALSWAFKERGDVEYHPRYDSRHSLGIIGGIALGSGWHTTISWNFSTGMPFTPVNGFFDVLTLDNIFINPTIFNDYDPFTIYGERNSQRLPEYHRLDISIGKKFTTGLADIGLDFSILNIYDRKNLFYFDKDTGERINMLPFLPSFSLKVEL